MALASLNKRALTIAKSWLGTPYHHQASVKDVGADCLGLIRGVWLKLYGDEPEILPAYSMDWNEANNEISLSEKLRQYFNETTRYNSGQVLLFKMQGCKVAKHLGILSKWHDGNDAFIHSYSKYGVVETPLSLPWKRRIIGKYNFPRKE